MRALLTVGIQISEFMAENDSVLADEDGHFSDWVELHNTSAAPVNLNGWFLTDNANNLTKWQFPNVTLAADQYLVVFASDKNRSTIGPGLNLHTNFKLSADGEYLGLVQPDGATVEFAYSPEFPSQQENVSYGVAQGFLTDSLLGAGAAGNFLVPTADPLAGDWRTVGFDDTAWTPVTTGIGYQNVPAGANAAPVGYWTFDNTDADASGFNHPASRVGASVTYSATVPSQLPGSTRSLSMTGVANQYVIVNPMNVSETSATISMWFKTSSAGRGLFTVAAGNFGAAGNDRSLYLNSTNLAAQIKDTATTSQTITAGGTSYANNAWHHVVYVFSQGSTTQRLYIDGNPVPAATGTASASTLTAQDRIYIGFSPPATSDFFSGLIDDVAIWNAALSPGQIGALYNGISPLELQPFGDDLATSVDASMHNVNSTAYLRLPFNVADVNQYDSLTLKLKYDDGAVAYLNGVEIASRNAPAALDWNSAATQPHPNSQAVVGEEIDVTAHLNLLQNGPNVLALQGLNVSASDSDFLLSAELADIDIGGLVEQFYDAPTPGGVNSVNSASFVEDPLFSISTQTFTTNFSLTLSTATPDATIRYTTNGSIPTEGSTLYTGPIAITATSQIRARAFKTGENPSSIVSQFYTKLNANVQAFGSNLPVIVVNTFGGTFGDTALTPVTAQFFNRPGERNNLSDVQEFSSRGGMRLRGQSSQDFAKKQYAFETWDEANDDQAVSLLGMPADSDWVIYAPFTDKQLMQNPLAYELSNEIGRYAVRTQYVELYIDTNGGELMSGDYLGVYVFMEKIKQGVDRVDVERLGPTNNTAPDITGGYIFSKDKDDPVANYKFTTARQSFHHVYPDGLEVTTAQKNYLTNYMNGFETALYGANFADPATGYAAWIDVDSFIDHHIIVELAKNIDGYRISTYYHKDRGGKVTMGPVWDYNLAFSNANYLQGWTPIGWYGLLLGDGDYPYFRRLFEDPNFQQRYHDRWAELREDEFATERLMAKIDRDYALLAEAQPRDAARWTTLGNYLWPNVYFGVGDAPHSQAVNNHPARTYRDEVAFMKQWLHDRLLWIDSQFLQSNSTVASVKQPSFSQDGGPIDAGYQLEITGTGGLIYYTLDGSDPRASGGTVAGTATQYTGPITLDANTKVIARQKVGNIWSAPQTGVFEVDAADLVISEIMYHPSLPPPGQYVADDFEFVEVHNVGATPIDLTGFKFTRGIDFTFASATLGPGEFGVIVSNAAAFATRYPSVTPLGDYAGTLDNGGETLRLEDNVGVVLFDHDYENDWEPHTGGDGFSLVSTYVSPDGGPLYTSGEGSDQWRGSQYSDGNPGSADGGVQLKTVVINEVLSNPSAPQGSWVELYNSGAAAVDLSGWYLSDDSANLTKYEIAAGTTIDAGGYLVLTEQSNYGNVADPGSHVQFSLGARGETLTLSSPAAGVEPGGYRQVETFGAAALDVTLGRYIKSTGGKDFVALTSPTQNGANAAPVVGPVVISEVMYHPAAGGDEFIEIHNTSANPVDLFDPANPTNTWQITGGVNFAFPEGATLAGGGYALVVPIAPGAFRSKYVIPAEIPIYGPYTGNLGDGGEGLEISRPDVPDASGVPYISVDRVVYKDNTPWSPLADGNGPALARLSPTSYGNDVANWTASHGGGSPGADNSPVDTSPPTQVDGVTYVRTGVGTVNPRTNVIWNAATDDQTAVAYYKVYRVGSESVPTLAAPILIGTSTGTSFVDNSVVQTPFFEYRVSAVNTDGLEGPLSDLGPTLPIAAADSYTVLEDTTLTTTTAPDVPTSLVDAGATWKYLDNGSNQGTAWREAGFDDGLWAVGAAQLGYGDGDEATVVNYGPDVNNRFVTTYFRRQFTATDAALFDSLTFNVLRDDGVSVFLNGVEIIRNGLPGVLGDNSVAFNTLANQTISGAEETTTFLQFDVPVSRLVEGTNTLAVEIHQVAGNSTDVSFDLSALATRRRSGLLSNDLDPESDPLTAVKLSDPASGTLLSFNPNGTFSYQPHENFAGADSFTYRAVDSSNNQSSVVTVSINVIGTNDAPTAHAGGPYSTQAGVPLQLDGTASTDPETPAGNLTYEWDYDYDGATFDVDASGSQPSFESATPFAVRSIALRVADPAGASHIATTTLEVTSASATVVGRHVFYNQSAWDGNSAAINMTDNAAIAPDKTALLPGGTGTFANYTSYDKGINGLMIDLAGTHGAISASDFAFATGNVNDTASWTALATAPTVDVRVGGGVGGSDRITLTFPTNTVRKTWLQVRILAGANSNLAVDDVFYFGNAVGEAGDTTANALVNATDEIQIRANPRNIANPAPVDFKYDIDRNKLVNATDQILARSNTTNIVTTLRLIVPTAAPGAVPPEAGALADAALIDVAANEDDLLALRRRR